MSLLSVTNLTIGLPKGADRSYAVKDVSFDLQPAEMLCIVGESGSGKSMSANAIMGLLAEGLSVASGSITFDGQALTKLTEAQMRQLRGRRLGMIFQEPLTALNPLMPVGRQIEEVFEAHNMLTPATRRDRVIELLTEVGLPDPVASARAYPFQMSGGQRQRVVIAMALALEPAILIADEPTTALDVTTQAQILRLLDDLRRKHDMGVVFITHDLGVVADIADRVLVMQHGVIVEEGAAADVLLRPQHPYTQALLDAIPRLKAVTEGAAVYDAPLLQVKGLHKQFRTGGGWLGGKARVVTALDDISFDLHTGETIGIVGESGSGKSTLGRAIVRLQEVDRGQVLLNGLDMSALKGEELRRDRKRVQMIFQDPYSSLPPRQSVGKSLTEGQVAHGTPVGKARERAIALLERVGLDAGAMSRFPHEFSGGQRQRIGIARALVLDPELIVADEAVSALDVSVQAQVLDLLEGLKRDLNLSMLFITHDLRVAGQICDRLIVMQKGRIVETGDAAQILNNPTSDYARGLLAALPGRDFETARAQAQA
ncbi:ABC transporter ATP-binding protein [Paracoccus sp. JM45]|uniref:ABC transporter ATP-binding protein n=1 Tax=Paracoccus sp. JM45 TaxID=2283626 RepID=UPI000E6BCCC3|nr:ABC transporter ATP-binding protein [Paracoccus sp. JM45]RJE79223.1 ABC transporter ATP-binding protein [Paracoccus sp. JM45]